MRYLWFAGPSCAACPTYNQIRKAIDYFLDDVDATEESHEEYVRVFLMKSGPRCFFFVIWKSSSKLSALIFGMQ